MKKIILVALASLALSGCSLESPFKEELKCKDGESLVEGKCFAVEAPKKQPERTYNTVETSFKSYLETLYQVDYLKLYCETGQADGDQRQSCTATFDSGRERITVKSQCYADGSGCS